MSALPLYQSTTVTDNTDSVNFDRLQAAAQCKFYTLISYNSNRYSAIVKQNVLTANQQSMHRMVVTQTKATVTKTFKLKQSVTGHPLLEANQSFL